MGGRQRCLDELLAAWQAGLHRPLFIIQHALYFGLGARLITAYSVHKEEPDITSPCHRQWGAIWTSGEQGGDPVSAWGSGHQCVSRPGLLVRLHFKGKVEPTLHSCSGYKGGPQNSPATPTAASRTKVKEEETA